MKVTCSESVFTFMLYFHTIHSRPLQTLRAVRPALLWAITQTHTCLLIRVSVSFKAPSMGTWIDRDLKCVGPWRDLLFYALKPGDSPHGVLISYTPTHTHTHTRMHTPPSIPYSPFYLWKRMTDFTQGCAEQYFQTPTHFRVGMTCESGSAHLPWVKSFHRVTVETWMLRWIWLIQEQNRKSHPCGERGFAKLDMFLDQHPYWCINIPINQSISQSINQSDFRIKFRIGATCMNDF